LRSLNKNCPQSVRNLQNVALSATNIWHIFLLRTNWPFDLKSGDRVTFDVGYLCANFGLPRPLCYRLRPDVRNRQTSERCQTKASLNAPPIRGGGIITSCRRAATTICPRPGLQRKRAAAALSQAGRAGPDQPIRAIQPAGCTRRPPTRCTRQTSDRQTSDVRQHHRIMPP